MTDQEDWPSSRSKREEAPYCQQSMRGLQFEAICSRKIMPGTPPDIYTRALTNINALQSGGILSNIVC